MRVKTFVGDTMQEAVAQMRDEFGPDAVILDTRLGRRRGFLGLFGRRMVEVIAALENESTTAIDNRGNQPRESSGRSDLALETPRNSLASSSTGRQIEAAEETESKPAQMVWQMYQETLLAGRQISDANSSQAAASTYESAYPVELQEIERRLADGDVDPRLAMAIVQSVWKDVHDLELAPEAITAKVKERIAAMLRCVPPWEFDGSGPVVVALIGPTGVGKTTTLAKIAANYSLIARADVALITLDTYRVGAVEQLRTYSEIIGIPLKIVETCEDIKQVVEDWSRKDLILIDTAGTSQRDTERLQEMGKALEPIADLERHLVFSATTRYRDLVDIIRRFDSIGFDRLIATKLDETNTYGLLLTAFAVARRPYSFLADGQKVPECIHVAEAMQITNLILGDA